jgi:hypothetical protein
MMASVTCWYLAFVTPAIPHLVGKLCDEQLDDHEQLSAWLALRGWFKLSWLCLCLGCQTVWTTVLFFLSAAVCLTAADAWPDVPTSLLIASAALPIVAVTIKIMRP